ncbi:Fis family transcriptional regulator [Pandoraea pneumonica]|jgi:DNA-binding NtrC family response regulator/predicted hydrocarbon binding protein|uniref:Fis family transcriptional regulator n=1 Tax=Pandoraea pneumonica TaxID=2508299 RepID=A0A5E4Y7P1_9BURK|nr:sigma-54-dependent Fis family transcriptional regulator [Pandoraea pneumonica]VVE44305.1 Fis family transcriptional regulator [Pandoraea pneumonica]
MPVSPPPKGIAVPDVLVDLKLPQVRDLANRLRFSVAEGRIWLGERRVVLLHAQAFAALRDALIETLGMEQTRMIITRIGYEAGQRDAEMVTKMGGPNVSWREVLNAGGTLHALQGFLLPEHAGPGLAAGDLHADDYCGEAIWKESLEDEAHIASHGVGAHAVCWNAVGYCSGYLTVCAQRQIVVREVECRSMGHVHCRIIARPASEWADAQEDLRYLLPQERPARVHVASTVGSDVGDGSGDGGGDATSGAPHQLPRVDTLGAAAMDDAPESLVTGTSTAFTLLRHKIERVAGTQATVLLLGESGVGKSLIAREIHRLSQRAAQPFVEVNCAAIPEALIESELFGVERGAYSGATTARVGRFEAAHGGTLFLDEIATLSMTAQGKLLRVLQNGQMERLGSNRTVTTDVRVISATNEPLKIAVQEGRFREDLYFRLNVFPMLIQPLRERRDDIPVLAEVLLRRFANRHSRAVPSISPRAMRALMHHDWPGNIRELENMLERGLIMVPAGETLDIVHLTSVEDALSASAFLEVGRDGGLTENHEPLSGDVSDSDSPGLSLDTIAEDVVRQGTMSLPQMEDALVRAAVKQAGGNISRAAGLLGITRSQLDYRVKRLGDVT